MSKVFIPSLRSFLRPNKCHNYLHVPHVTGFFHLNFAPILPRSSWPHPHTSTPRHYQWTCSIYNMTIFIDLLSVSVDRFKLKFWNFNWSVTLAYLSNGMIQSKSCNTTVRNYTNWRWNPVWSQLMDLTSSYPASQLHFKRWRNVFSNERKKISKNQNEKRTPPIRSRHVSHLISFNQSRSRISKTILLIPSINGLKIIEMNLICEVIVRWSKTSITLSNSVVKIMHYRTHLSLALVDRNRLWVVLQSVAIFRLACRYLICD